MIVTLLCCFWRFYSCYFSGYKHKNCDIAAVKVIVEEAGGIVTDLFGNEQRYDDSINEAVVSNGKVHVVSHRVEGLLIHEEEYKKLFEFIRKNY